MSENLADRLDAVERALTDGDADLTEVRERAALSGDVDRLETRVEELEAQVEQLEAALEAVRGYAGNVRAVNREVERRASAALAKAEALETAVDGTVDDPVVADAGGTVEAGIGDGGGDAVAGGTPRSESGSETVSDLDSETAGGAGNQPPGTSTNDRPRAPSAAGQPTGPAGPDEFDWGLDEGRDSAGRGNESRRPEDSTAAGRDSRQHGTGDRSNSRSRSKTARARSDATGHDDDEGSGTEQFIERVRDAL
jgi:outer membrane murein-binding lipoprotein Lpp